MGSVLPKPQGLTWGQLDPAKDNQGAFPGRQRMNAEQARTADATENTFVEMVSEHFRDAAQQSSL